MDVFQQIAARAQAHTFGQIVAVLGNRQHQHRLLRMHAHDLRQGFAAVHHRHIQIQQHHVRSSLLNQFQAAQAVRRFAHHLAIRLSR